MKGGIFHSVRLSRGSRRPVSRRGAPTCRRGVHGAWGSASGGWCLGQRALKGLVIRSVYLTNGELALREVSRSMQNSRGGL